MKIEFEAPKNVTETYDRPEPGCFSSTSEPLLWTKCRETFAASFCPAHPGFFFSIESGKAESVVGFLSKTEDVLDLDGKGQPRSSFAKTNRSYVIWINPSPWWSACEMRRSLYTILLRVGQQYDPTVDNYDKTLYSDPQKFVQSTKPAVMRFLFGFTKFIPDEWYQRTSVQHRQWVSFFEKKTEDEVRRHLVAEVGEPPCLVGVGSLWN